MQKVLVIGIAGLAGTLARYWLTTWLDAVFGEAFPAGTLCVNLAGCFLAGFCFHALNEKYVIDPVLSASILIGFLGGFTTFSAYGIQSFTLLKNGELTLAGLNVMLSNLAGLLMVWLGYNLSKTV